MCFAPNDEIVNHPDFGKVWNKGLQFNELASEGHGFYVDFSKLLEIGGNIWIQKP